MADLKVNKINGVDKLQYGARDVLLENPTVANYENKDEMNTKYQQKWVMSDSSADLSMNVTTTTLSITPNTLETKVYNKIILSEFARSNATLNYRLMNSSGFEGDGGANLFPFEMRLNDDSEISFSPSSIKTNTFNNNEAAGITFFITYINSVYFKVEVYNVEAGMLFQGTATELRIQKTGGRSTAQFKVKYLK